jgi:hypothetical protein
VTVEAVAMAAAAAAAAGEAVQGGGSGATVRFCRYRLCATGELKYRGAVG